MLVDERGVVGSLAETEKSSAGLGWCQGRRGRVGSNRMSAYVSFFTHACWSLASQGHVGMMSGPSVIWMKPIWLEAAQLQKKNNNCQLTLSPRTFVLESAERFNSSHKYWYVAKDVDILQLTNVSPVAGKSLSSKSLCQLFSADCLRKKYASYY